MESHPFSIEMPAIDETKTDGRQFAQLLQCDFNDMKCLQSKVGLLL